MASPVENNVSSDDWLCIQMRRDRIEFEWTIKKFNLLPQKNGERIRSPAFPNNSTEQWRICIYPQGDKEENAGWISVYLCYVSNNMVGIKIECKFLIFQFNKALETREFVHKFEKSSGFGFPSMIERSKLSVEDGSTDSITIHCKIEMLGTNITSSSKTECSNMAASFKARKNRITTNFRSLYKNPTLTDFTVISGNRTFSTHKVILASRCPIFAAMFQHKEVGENVEKEVKIEDIEPAVVERLLEFIYTDDVSEIGELADKLLVAAEQYGLKDLKNLCEEALYKTLNVENAAELLGLADLHNAYQLKKYSIQYVAAHREDVVKSEAFESLKLSEKLSKDIIRALALPASEKSAT